MPTVAAFLGRADRLCARMNAGLVAFASARALVVVVTGALPACAFAARLSLRAAALISANATDRPAVSGWTYD